MTVTVVIADDHPIVREGLRAVLEAEGVEVLGEAGDGGEAVRLAEALRPSVVLMDLRMPGMDGVEATARITAGAWATVLILTTYDTDADVARAVAAGATGYLLKDTPRRALADAVAAAARGETVLAEGVAARLVAHVRARGLSPRELEVLRAVARGLSNPEIGRELFIGEATVKSHLTSVFAKLGVKDRTAAVMAAMEKGVLGP
ncbi:DNA-binding response regulator [Actinorhabdospora filicis]|uniref:DNA-binding response regulator n=1 Tax=Actinorhabdospora filicis TaxID=1785913 RepID=A0A9W6SRZ6_9ACTN|nr:response regulator transcription factor [Actinorhabdospora filicis]GLZ81273.1 DNA-binding response regulator [Actinorhabdospora filicis]